MLRPLRNLEWSIFGKIFSVGGIFLLMFVVINLSGCSGNCNAGGNAYGGKVLCKALDF